MIDAAELKSVLHYDAQTGQLSWIKPPRRGISAGPAAQRICKDGYRRLKVREREYLAHRVAWALHYGAWPDSMIDHINGDRADNRIANLRCCTNAQNVAHQHKAKPSESGLRGVRAQRKKWAAVIVVNYRPIHLGTFENKEDAAAAYRIAAEQHFGAFAPKIKEAHQ